MDCFVAWCRNNHLIFKVNKTKEIIVDFKRTRNKSNSISVIREEVEVVEEYKYLSEGSEGSVQCSPGQQTGLESVMDSVTSSAVVC